MKVLINVNRKIETVSFDFEGMLVTFNFEIFNNAFGGNFNLYSIQALRAEFLESGAFLVDSIATMCQIEETNFEIIYKII